MTRRRFFPLLLLILSPPPAAGADPILTGFAYDLPGGGADDAVEVYNPGPGPVELNRLSLSDGEGRLGFPGGQNLAANASLRLAGNATAYRAAARTSPDRVWEGSGANVNTLEGAFRLAKDGDEILLFLDDRLVDVVAYGDASYAGPGWEGASVEVTGGSGLRWVPRGRSLDGWRDTDSAAEWESPKRFFLGQTPFAFPAPDAAASALAYTAPERARAVVEDFVERAEHRLWINVYEFLDASLANRLADAARARPGFDLRLLLDESPVGADDHERALRNGLLHRLLDDGATVRLMRHDRYNFDHAKYAVADDRWVLIQSENFVASGIPVDPSRGNRGWGVVLDSPALAGRLARVFEADFERDDYGARDVGPEEAETIPPPVPVPSGTGTPTLDTLREEDVDATLLVVPDATLGPDDPILRILNAAETELLVEQLEFPPVWRDSAGRKWPNQYLEALLEASQRGVRVRILLDGHFARPGHPGIDNADTVDYLQEHAQGLPLEVRLQDKSEAPLLHVKGLVSVGQGALVGSMNWNLNSVAQNREIDVWLASPALAAHYQVAFEADWAAAPTEPAPGLVPALSSLAIIITAALLPMARGRRGTL